MSHELRTPLNAIIGFSDLIDDEMFGPVGNWRYAGYIKDINASGRHLLGIVNDVLDLSKLEARSMRLSQDEIDPVALAGECAKLVGLQAEARKVALCVENPEVPVRVTGDAMRLRQVLLNLLSNAVKFSYPGGLVTITERLDPNGGLVIAVRDQGIGMDLAGIATALQPFGQVENGWTRTHAGTGSGLPLAKWLVDLHDGQLEVESAPGQGTTVRVSLPPTRVTILEKAEPALIAAE